MYSITVDGSHVMQFARAVGDLTPDFYDVDRLTDTGPQALVAPPTFLMAADHFDPHYIRRPQLGKPWISSQPATAEQPLGFHTEQHFTFHRPVRVGDRLVVSQRRGESWEKFGRRAGRMTFHETFFDYHDHHGEIVASARWVETAVERNPATSTEATVGATSASTPTTTPPPDLLSVGTSWSQVVADEITRTGIVMYAGTSGDFHPLHCDDVYARQRGYPGVFAHGMLTMGLTGSVITDVVGHESIQYFGGRIRGQVWPGDRLHAAAEVESADDAVAHVVVRTRNQHGDVVFDGSARVLLSQSADRRVPPPAPAR